MEDEPREQPRSEPRRPEHEDLVMLLGTVPERIADLTSNLDEARLRYRHGPAFPTLQELIAHLAESGGRADALLRHAYLDHKTELDVREAIDPGNEPDSGVPVSERLETFLRARRRTVEMLRGLTDEDWELAIDDPRQGELSLLDVTRQVTEHELSHIAQIRNLSSLLPEHEDLGPIGRGLRNQDVRSPRS